MAITQTLCTSFKKALLDAEMDFSSDTAQVFKIALYTSNANLGADTTVYSTDNEVAGAGYSAGGTTLTISTNPTTSSGTAFISFSNAVWVSTTITARGALIYKSGGLNPAVAVLDFGGDKSATNGIFTVQFPLANADSAIVRIE